MLFARKSQFFLSKTCIVQKIAIPLHRFYGDSLAQLVEHIPFKDGVVGSNPTRITKKIAGRDVSDFFATFFCYIKTFLKESLFLF